MTSTQFTAIPITFTEESEDDGGNGSSIIGVVVFIIIAILGIMGNGLVLFVFYKVRELHVFTNILIAHQSIVDLLSSAFLFLNFLIPGIDLAPLSVHHYSLANFICKILVNEYLYWTLLKVSTTNLVFITIERYLAVVHPIKYRKTASKRVAISVCVLAWILSAIINLYFPLTYHVSEAGECTSDSLKRGSSGRYVIALVTVMTTLVLPVAIMLYVYMAIVWKLRPVKSEKPSGGAKLGAEMSSSGNTSLQLMGHSADDRSQQRPPEKKTAGFRERGRRNVLITLFIVSLTYTICWTPDMVLYFHHNVITPHDWSDPFHQLALFLAVSNVCVNPIIYTFKYKSFQKGLKQLFKKSTDKSGQKSATAPTSTTGIV
ncbi:Somatostatin receptor type 1 [Holothuria leucospilota]|uniref:Somatostatin receptor type 1 n=1 Tax=Holothuria leucospilota TaxID=206669 RepID=A0A9Q1CH83_HOLLE|nr:Somatostatin receptor type 1 [Holothuria leucospilota]